jgi:DNA-binding PadR family transcriptional regulator
VGKVRQRRRGYYRLTTEGKKVLRASGARGRLSRRSTAAQEWNVPEWKGEALKRLADLKVDRLRE